MNLNNKKVLYFHKYNCNEYYFDGNQWITEPNVDELDEDIPQRQELSIFPIIPTIGIPLPYVSYGGSSFLSFSIMFFIYLNFDSSRLKED